MFYLVSHDYYNFLHLEKTKLKTEINNAGILNF